jgi:hypothetical protein
LVAEEYILAADAGARIVVFALPGETIVRPRLLIRSLVIRSSLTTPGAGAFFESGSLSVLVVGFSTEVGAWVPKTERVVRVVAAFFGSPADRSKLFVHLDIIWRFGGSAGGRRWSSLIVSGGFHVRAHFHDSWIE